jgi:hypothetical protein
MLRHTLPVHRLVGHGAPALVENAQMEVQLDSDEEPRQGCNLEGARDLRRGCRCRNGQRRHPCVRTQMNCEGGARREMNRNLNARVSLPALAVTAVTACGFIIYNV